MSTATATTITTADNLTVPSIVLDDIVKASVKESLQPYLFGRINPNTISSALTTANDTVNRYYGWDTGTSTDDSTTTCTTYGNESPFRFAKVNYTTNDVILSSSDIATDYNEYTQTSAVTDGTNAIHFTGDSAVNLYDYAKFDQWGIHVKDKKEELRDRFRSNLIIRTKSRADILDNITDNERIAMETLREMISEADYRKYVKDGFILVKATSGKVYQIFRTRWHTRVWRGGKVIEEICVRIRGEKIPPTDNVIAFKTMLETDEEDFRKVGNLYKLEKAA